MKKKKKTRQHKIHLNNIKVYQLITTVLCTFVHMLHGLTPLCIIVFIFTLTFNIMFERAVAIHCQQGINTTISESNSQTSHHDMFIDQVKTEA